MAFIIRRDFNESKDKRRRMLRPRAMFLAREDRIGPACVKPRSRQDMVPHAP